jgi:tight adherence protein B
MNRLVLGVLALLCLAAIAATPSQGQPRMQLSEAGAARFPDRSYVLTLPERRALDASQLSLTESRGAPTDVRVVPGNAAGTRTFALMLVIDASNSMRGAPLGEAMKAARAFAAQRGENQPMGVVFFSDQPRVALSPTVDPERIAAVLAEQPVPTLGTHIYDATALAIAEIEKADVASGTVVVLSDGDDTGSATSAKALAANARQAHARVFTVGLQSPDFDPAELQQLAASGRGEYAEAGTAAQLEQIFAELGERFGNEYLVTYRSTAPLGSRVRVTAEVEGISGAASLSYEAPRFQATLPGRSPSGDAGWWSSTAAAVLLALLLALLIGLASYTLLRPRKATVRDRVRGFVAPASAPAADPFGRRDAASVLAGAERSLAKLRGWKAFQEEVEIARLELPALHIALFTLATTIALTWLFGVALDRPVLGVLCLGLPVVVLLLVKSRADRERRAFADQLPDNLQVLASAMRAGHSLIGALSVAVNEADEPVRTEFKRVLTDEQLGVAIEDAFESVGRRMRCEDIAYVGVIAQLQRETGGNTAEVLDRVVETIQERAGLRRLVHSLTAQGRLGGAIVSALPFVVMGIVNAFNPDYLDPLVTTTAGKLMLALGLVMIVAGWTSIRRIVDIRV